MTYLRWLHKTWNFFWTFIGVLLLTLVLICGIIFGAMQLQPAKDYVAGEIEQRFNSKYNGVLSIGEFDGLLPVLFQLKDVRIYSDSTEYEPVFEASTVDANLDVFSLLKNRMVIKGIRVKDSRMIADSESSFSIEHALLEKNVSTNYKEFREEALASLRILIPSIVIENGDFLIRNAVKGGIGDYKSDSLSFKNVNLDMYLEFSETQRLVDIGRLTFQVPELNIADGLLFGQIYNDSEFLEFNAVNIRMANSSLVLNGEAEGVNFLNSNIGDQLAAANLDIEVSEMAFVPISIQKFIPDFPNFHHVIKGSINGEGTFNSFWLRDIDISVGESFAYGNGFLLNLLNNSDFSYGFTLDGASVAGEELDILPVNLTQTQAEAISESHLEGTFEGIKNEISGNLLALSDRGQLKIDGKVSLTEETAFNLSIKGDSLDIGGLFNPRITTSDLSFNGNIQSSSFDFLNNEGNLSITFEEGSIDQRNFDQISATAKWREGFFEPDINLVFNGSSLAARGWIDLKQEQNEFTIHGEAKNFEIKEWLKIDEMNPAVADIEYDFSLKGNSFNELHGQLSLDVLEAVVGNDTLNRHQLYFDLNEPESNQRLFRFTSTAFDATLEGSFIPTNLVDLSGHWGNYFSERFEDEFLLRKKPPADSSKLNIPAQNITLTGQLKNTQLIKAYFPDFPEIASSANLNSTINASSDRLLFNATLQDPLATYNDYRVDSLLVQVTGGFRHSRLLKEFSGLQVQANAAYIDSEFMDGHDFELDAELNRDSIRLRNTIGVLAGNPEFLIETHGRLQENSLAFSVKDFSFGQNQYQWKPGGDASIVYNENEKLTFSNFSFQNEDQFIRVNGTFSDNMADSVNYEIGGVRLNRISRLLEGRLSFGGILDGVFTTRTLTTIPTIQGDINVEEFDIDGNTVGDIKLSSRYNQQLHRFDTNINVSTDSTKYPNYYSNNERRGQQFDIEGYVQAPQDGNFPDTDSLFIFNIDFDNIDMWILPLIGPKIFTEGAGISSGTGKIWGNRETYDFRADFLVGTEDAVYFRPRFLDTYYYAQGGITFTRDRGLEFNDIFLIDPSGGTAILSGFFDFNDFQPISYVGIKLEMDEFQFLNSFFDPSAPFYGNAYGTSTVTITGTNLNPVLSSETPIILSDFSDIGIPLLEETEFNEDNKFIRFVDSFDKKTDASEPQTAERRRSTNRTEEQAPVDLSFVERFTLDLQFEAYDPMTVQLIFDPVTGDIVTADGTGRMRILLEDEQVSMFGRFDITGGRYQFVSGDIFSRRFELESGGSITWEGDPGNARLDLNAVYRARPDINTLTTSRSEINPENSQRVPVELVLNIGGTISGIENNFYFRLPETFESRQSSTLATQLASLNRDEELKLIQSANFLLMGDFIPVSDTQNNLFGENLSGSAAVLNPLLSSQVISPLLSNQMNSLLNSDLSSLDVDFNLNTYNQVDLGVALRLYNDKLILRREGQITGRQSNIGDLGATYRINRTFAVTAFHRQDPTFGTLSSTEQSQQSQDINGLGVEAKFSFNTWKEFFNRIFTPFRKILGINGKEQESLTENKEGRNPS